MVKKAKRRVRRRRPGRGDDRPLLSLAMMVRDEERFLEDALRSARDLCDELVVVDTGSTDRTVEIARDLGAVVSHFPWCDDFSAARNETLRRATGRYVLVLDADERLRGPDPAGLRRLLVPGPQHPFEAISLEVINTTLDGSPLDSFHSVRVFPNDRRLGYRGRVHNAFGPLVDGAPRIAARIYAGLRVIHLGYDPQLYAERKKAERSLPLIEKTVAEAPDDHRYRFYLGREYLLLGRLAEARDALRAAIDGGLRDGTGPIVEATVHWMRAMVQLDAPPVETLDVARAVLAARPDHPDLWFGVARAMALAGERAAAADAAERALRLLDHAVLDTQVELRHKRWSAHALLGELYWALGRYPESHRHHLAAIEGKPADSAGWGRLLNQACALAIELGDAERLPGLLDRLLDHPEAPLGMFFFALDRVITAEGSAAGRAMLEAARAQAPRVVDDPEYPARAVKLGLDPPPGRP